MKNLLKNLVLTVVLSVTFSAFTACNSSDTTQANKGENSQVPDVETVDKKSKDDSSVPPPAEIANAEFKLLDGGTFKLTENKGKVVLINLWATWCGPCRKEMPELVAMQEKYRDKNFIIVGLDTDPEPEAEIKEFAKKMNLNYTLGWAERDDVVAFFKLGQMDGIPQSFLINKEGNLVGIYQGGSENVVKKMAEHVDRLVNST
jgi:thiol-disulfide isomerase/thioredoxin